MYGQDTVYLCLSKYIVFENTQQYKHGVASPHLVPEATVTTGAKPHGQQQLARDLEVERAVMGQRCRPHAAMLSAVFRFTYSVLL